MKEVTGGGFVSPLVAGKWSGDKIEIDDNGLSGDDDKQREMVTSVESGQYWCSIIPR